ncbi:hypothetical protein CH375_06580 [Leptospira ellisii]|nr:hypothetical protein CH379_11170 [Leptospira ellisii]PKA05196.1 hypothetical protein CH375_06580 [Leptospira ellisii]
MNPIIKESIEWHFKEGYTVVKTCEILSWSNPGLRPEIVQAEFARLESRIPKAGSRKEEVAA